MEMSTVRSVVCTLFVVLAMTSAAAEVRLTPGVPILVSRREPESVQRAVKDLQRDLKAVLGSDPALVDRLGA
jgi:hypothetical protein